MVDVKFICLSLQKPARMELYKRNHISLPRLELMQSVNGYNIGETLWRLKQTKLKFITLDEDFQNFGTLACFITKYNCLLYQVHKSLPFMCAIEDDMLLGPGFEEFVQKQAIQLSARPRMNMVRLGEWGEGYITTLAGAKRIIELIKSKGIIRNIDNQLREHCGKEIYKPCPCWQRTKLSEQGDIIRTKSFGRRAHKFMFHSIIHGDQGQRIFPR